VTVARSRRRGGASAADERVRISEELRHIQQDLSYHQAWLAIESADVAAAYAKLVAETRQVAGGQIRQAWLASPIESDDGMNMPDLGLGALAATEARYLLAASDELSTQPTFWRRWRRKRAQPDLLTGVGGSPHSL
jgi:hypothetical protein